MPARLASADDPWLSWTEIRSPHFVVITNAGDKQGRRIANQFEQMRALFETSLKVRVDPGKPFTVLAPKDQKTLKQLLPAFWETKGSVQPGGIFVPGLDKHYAVVRLDASGENPYHIVFHEYVHMLVNLNFRSLPLWVNEGIAEFYGNSVFESKIVGVGRPIESRLLQLQQSRLLPLEELFTVDHSSPHYTQENKASIFYAQSWALTHYLILGERQQGGSGTLLTEYLNLVLKGEDEEEAARKVLGNLEKLQTRLEGYVRQTSYPYVRLPAPAKAREAEFAARALPAGEALAVIGDFHSHNRRPREAATLLEGALQREPRLALAHESLGFLRFNENDRRGAAEAFEQAVKLESLSFLTWYYHARMNAEQGRGDADFEKAEKSLARAIELNGQFAPAYSALASLYMRRESTAQKSLDLAVRAVQLEPGVIHHRVVLANGLMRVGRIEEAVRIAEHAEKHAASPHDRAMAAAFLENARRYSDQMARRKEAMEVARQADEERDRRRREEMARINAEESRPPAPERARPAPAAAPSSASDPLTDEVELPAEIAQAGVKLLAGTVRKVSCKASAIEIVLEGEAATHLLHAPDLKKVHLQTRQGRMMPGFNLCVDLREMRVIAGFKPASAGARLELAFIQLP